jgi:hypothetical protein
MDLIHPNHGNDDQSVDEPLVVISFFIAPMEPHRDGKKLGTIYGQDFL